MITTDQFLKFFKDPFFVLFHDSEDRGPIVLKQTFNQVLINQKQDEGYGVFFTFNQFPNERLKAECKGINAWAVDIDAGGIPIYIQELRIKQAPIKPSFVVRTKNGHHVYYLAKDGKIDEYVEVIKRVISFFDADENAKDYTRVLRVPGFYHLKDQSDPYRIEVVQDNDVSYTTAEMLAAFPDFEKVEKNIWEQIKELDNKKMLEYFSGKSEVKGDVFSFKENSNGTQQIWANDKSTSCWIDQNGMIGSSANGGPSIIQWLGWYGHTKAQIAKIFKAHGLVKEPTKLPEAKAQVLQPTSGVPHDPKEFNSEITIINNCYHLKKFSKEGGVTTEKITNFILKTTNIFKELGTNEYTREFILVNEAGKSAGPFKMRADEFASLTEFKKFCIGKGRFVFFGKEGVFPKIQDFILYHSESYREVMMLPRIGYIPRHKVWIFNNFAVHENKVHMRDENGIIWIGDSGYQQVSVMSKNSEIDGTLPLINAVPEDVSEMQRRLISNICKSYGSNKFKIAVSWMYANVFTHEIMNEYKIFPLLYINGKTRSGKDVLSTWLISLFGLGHSSKESLPQMTSTVGINRKAAYYSCLPVVLDEYKNNFKIAGKFDGFFKNLATKTGVTKGTKRPGEIHYEPIHANFIFTSEELPEEPAIINRAIVLRINPAQRDDSFYNEINEGMLEYFNIGIRWIAESEENRQLFFSHVARLKQKLIDKGATTYTAEAYAIAGAGYFCLAKDEPDDLLIYERELVAECLANNKVKNDTDKLAQFWSDLESCHAENNLKGVCVAAREDNHIYFWTKYASDVWNEFRKRQGRDPYVYTDLLGLITESPACVDKTVQRWLMTGNRKCVKIAVDKMPDDMGHFFDVYFAAQAIATGGREQGGRGGLFDPERI